MKKHSLDQNYLLTIEQAGFDILYAFMLADGRPEESEFEIIKDYLKTDFIHRSSLFNEKSTFFGECNFNREYAYLQSLDEQSLIRRFKKALSSFSEWINDESEGKNLKKELLDFSLKLIRADGKITDEEALYLNILEEEWKIKRD